MYERPDVPKPSRHRTVIAIIVLLALAVGLVAGGLWLWAKANEDASGGQDPAMADQLAQSSTLETTATQGYHLTGHNLENILIFRVDSLDEGSTLDQVMLLSIDQADGAAHLLTIPSDLIIGVDGEALELSQAFAEKGEAGCVVPLSRALDQPIAHVMTLDSEGWELVGSLSSMGTSQIVSKAPELLAALHGDMAIGDLVSLAETLHGIGFSHIEQVNFPVLDGTDGTCVVNREALGVALGSLEKDG